MVSLLWLLFFSFPLLLLLLLARFVPTAETSSTLVPLRLNAPEASLLAPPARHVANFPAVATAAAPIPMLTAALITFTAALKAMLAMFPRVSASKEVAPNPVDLDLVALNLAALNLVAPNLVALNLVVPTPNPVDPTLNPALKAAALKAALTPPAKAATVREAAATLAKALTPAKAATLEEATLAEEATLEAEATLAAEEATLVEETRRRTKSSTVLQSSWARGFSTLPSSPS